jgi:hypothetical protein
MKREEQIKLIVSAEERAASYLQRWLQLPAFKAALHRQDRKGTDGDGGQEERPHRTACA